MSDPNRALDGKILTVVQPVGPCSDSLFPENERMKSCSLSPPLGTGTLPSTQVAHPVFSYLPCPFLSRLSGQVALLCLQPLQEQRLLLRALGWLQL